MSSTITSTATTITPGQTIQPPVNLPSTAAVFSGLLRADLTTQWRNRRASIMVILIPTIILMAWKGLVAKFGGAFVLSNCITVGLNAIGLMGYTNTVARDRDKGIFQRLRVTPAPRWIIIASRLVVQLAMIIISTLILFLIGYQFDHITMPATGYIYAFLAAIVGGAVYLSLGQVIVGLIYNPETVQVTTRLVYFAFIMIGMFAQFGMLGKELGNIADWSPYGAVRNIISASLSPATWNNKTSTALLITFGYTAVFTILGIRWFRWSNK
ncbi:ABC transporter permease [Puia dinghuensis]|uniref:Transport permease protein n=1 Tax=Puia dinghuensis TaxID=1792502 RepID=A0A8J2UH43_9BACT|nr:ABC transporter permease [Puia dinghuensis]GGB17266.1 transport permease protein [Puia dinghuensis]